MLPQPINFKSGDLQLEGLLYAPAGASAAVVVCHPHPLRGGDMRNNVVTAIVNAVNAAGVAALAFNFRGVGVSQGAHDEGCGEQDDVRAALAHAAFLEGIDRVGLTGYSFGADVAAAVASAHDDSLPAALVSLPTGSADKVSILQAISGPLLLITGDADHVCASEQLLLAAQARPQDATEVVIVPGVDHFWRGAESVLEQHIATWLTMKVSP